MLQDRNVLDAAGKVLAEHGPSGFTLERVASEAGLSRVTLHRRGIGRDELLGGLTEPRTLSELLQALRDQGAPEATLDALALSVSEAFAEQGTHTIQRIGAHFEVAGWFGDELLISPAKAAS